MKFQFYVKFNLIIATLIALCAIFFGLDNLTLKIHSLNSPGWDTFYKNYTIWAEWPVIVIGMFLIIKHNWRTGIWFGLIFALQGLTVNLLKTWINRPRPIEKFGHLIRHIPGETLSHFKGFPSGHTAAAFYATALIILSLPEKFTKNWIVSILICSAFLIGYSRIYLGQHSLEDTIAGCVIANAFIYLAGSTQNWFLKTAFNQSSSNE